MPVGSSRYSYNNGWTRGGDSLPNSYNNGWTRGGDSLPNSFYCGEEAERMMEKDGAADGDNLGCIDKSQ